MTQIQIQYDAPPGYNGENYVRLPAIESISVDRDQKCVRISVRRQREPYRASGELFAPALRALGLAEDDATAEPGKSVKVRLVEEDDELSVFAINLDRLCIARRPEGGYWVGHGTGCLAIRDTLEAADAEVARIRSEAAKGVEVVEVQWTLPKAPAPAEAPKTVNVHTVGRCSQSVQLDALRVFKRHGSSVVHDGDLAHPLIAIRPTEAEAQKVIDDIRAEAAKGVNVVEVQWELPEPVAPVKMVNVHSMFGDRPMNRHQFNPDDLKPAQEKNGWTVRYGGIASVALRSSREEAERVIADIRAVAHDGTIHVDYFPPEPVEHRVTVVRTPAYMTTATDNIAVGSMRVHPHPARRNQWVVSSDDAKLCYLAIRDTEADANDVVKQIRATPNGSSVNIDYRLPTPKPEPARITINGRAGIPASELHLSEDRQWLHDKANIPLQVFSSRNRDKTVGMLNRLRAMPNGSEVKVDIDCRIFVLTPDPEDK